MQTKYIVNDREGILNITNPINILPLPTLKPIQGLTLTDENFEYNYITLIDGINIGIDDFGSYYCDYCRTPTDDKFFYCNNCKKDMCMLCFEEVDEAVATKNGAQNYHLRKDTLDICRTHDLVSREPKCTVTYCNECNANILDLED